MSVERTRVIRLRDVQHSMEGYEHAGIGCGSLQVVYCCSARKASSQSGNRLGYSAGSASVAAARAFTLLRSPFHSCSISEQRDGRYVRAKMAASVNRPQVTSISRHMSTSCNMKAARKETFSLFAARALKQRSYTHKPVIKHNTKIRLIHSFQVVRCCNK
jgi:hypothetical protein